jgi:hypothetical protein
MEGEKEKESLSGAVCKVGNHKNEGTCADGWLLSEKEGLTKKKFKIGFHSFRPYPIFVSLTVELRLYV